MSRKIGSSTDQSVPQDGSRTALRDNLRKFIEKKESAARSQKKGSTTKKKALSTSSQRKDSSTSSLKKTSSTSPRKEDSSTSSRRKDSSISSQKKDSLSFNQKNGSPTISKKNTPYTIPDINNNNNGGKTFQRKNKNPLSKPTTTSSYHPGKLLDLPPSRRAFRRPGKCDLCSYRQPPGERQQPVYHLSFLSG